MLHDLISHASIFDFVEQTPLKTYFTRNQAPYILP